MQQPAHALLFSGHARGVCVNHHGLGLCSSAVLQFRTISVHANALVFWCGFNELSRRQAANPPNPLPKSSPKFSVVSLSPPCLLLPHIARAAIDDPGVAWTPCSEQTHDAPGSSRTATKPDGKPGRCFPFCFISCPQRVSAPLTACCLTRLLNLGYSCLCSRMATLFLKVWSVRCRAPQRGVSRFTP